MKITDLFRSLKQITVNTIDISFIKSSLNLLVKRANKNTIQMDTMQSEIDKVKEKTKDLKIIEGKIDAQLLPSYVEQVKDVYKDTITNEFYNVIVDIDPITQQPSYSRGDTEVQKVQGIIYHDVNENRVYRVSDLGRVIEITTSENYYTKEEADSNFASSTIKSTKVINITSEYDNIQIGNESLTNYISDTSYSNILSWINSGNLVIAKYNTSYYTLSNIVDNSIIFSTVTDSKTIETFTINDNDRVYYNSKQINVPELYVVPLTATISSLDIARYLDYLNDGKPVIFKQVTTSMDNPRVRQSTFIPVSYYYLDESSIHLWGFGEGGLNHITFTPQDAYTYHGNIEVINLAFANDIDQLYLDKQDALLSGINIKTINDQSILGSGNLYISDNSKEDKLEYCPDWEPNGIFGMAANIMYDFGTTDTVFAGYIEPDSRPVPIWYFTFTAESSACTVTLPTGVVLANGYTWDMQPGRKFFVKIMQNVAFVDWADPA